MREKAKGVRNCWCRIMLTMVHASVYDGSAGSCIIESAVT